MYNGSFTTPDCGEEVVWVVYDRPLKAKFNQILQIRQKLGWNVDQVGNYRRTQNPSSRSV